MSVFAQRLSGGAQIIGDNRTRFRLWAPGQDKISLHIEGGSTLPMVRGEAGWFELEAACGAGARYCYGLPDGTRFPDPCSRAQDGDIRGPSIVVDPLAYVWRHGNWRGRPWHEAVIYECHAGLFGGFAKLTEELPRLKALGVTAIELMPIAEFPGARNWGYDGVLPYAPESSYGAPDDLKALIDAAHGLGLMVFLDVVYNHFGPDGNWLHLYAPQFFRKEANTPWGESIDMQRPEVGRFFTDNALYWLNEYRFDGLRFDAVHAIHPTSWLEELAATIRAGVEPDRQVHLILENEENQARLLKGPAAKLFDAQWNDDFHHAVHVMLTGEHEGYYRDHADKPAERLARILSSGFGYQGEVSSLREGWKRGEPSGDLPSTAFVAFLQNHDQIGNRALGERLSSLVPDDALHAAMALLLLSPQTPMLFMGEEFGAREPFLFFTDHNAELAKLVREGRRKEFAAFPQFADPARREKIPDPNAPETFAASRIARDGAQARHWEDYVAGLIALRRERITPGIPGCAALGAKALGERAVLARWRLGGGETLTLLANLGTAAVAAPDLPQGAPLFASGAEPLGVQGCAGFSTVAWLAS